MASYAALEERLSAVEVAIAPHSTKQIGKSSLIKQLEQKLVRVG